MKGQPLPLVVHIIYALGTGGLENGLVNVINRTPAQRYRHAIVCLTDSSEFAGRISVPDVRIVTLHKKSGHDAGMYWRLWKALRELSPAIVHSRNLAALEAQALTILMPGVKRVHGEHGRDMSDLHGTNWKYRLLRKVMSLLIHRYIAVSRDLAAWLSTVVGIPAVRIRQIYNGVDQLRFRPSLECAQGVFPAEFLPSGPAVVLGSVGRLAEVKDHASLVHALYLLVSSRPELGDKLRLVLVGDGPLLADLERQIAEYGIGELVWLAGDREDVSPLLQAMDIFVLPSLAEGVSNTILEAMATGLPVVATDTGGNPELVEHGVNGYLLPVQDPQALSDTLLALIDAPDERVRMGENGLEKVRKTFDWDHTVAAYLAVYDQLLGRTGIDTQNQGNNTNVNQARVG